MKKNYETLDNDIIEEIGHGCSTFAKLLGVERVILTAEYSGRHKDNVLNGRLQALRKRGKIEFVRGRWQVAVPRFAEEQA